MPVPEIETKATVSPPSAFQRGLKRLFDFSVSIVAFVLFMPLFCLISLLIKITSKGPIFFRQERIGKSFEPFHIYKFRTMVQDAPNLGGPLTQGQRDPRITGVGYYLRKTKLDELPQLLNVITGDMSIVGPRPEVKKYVDAAREDYEELLLLQPGITGLASIKYHDEGKLLSESDDPEKTYLETILPDKISIDREYIPKATVFYDIYLILATIFTVLKPS
jgi:lipopolysaccharide/colanic/teichoic acid biosynthesis glycosyltransferase